MSFTVGISQFADLKARIRAFGEVVKSDVAMEGAAGMALVIYDEARMNVRVSSKAHFFHGRQFRRNGIKYLFQPGTLKAAIYRVYSPEKSGPAMKLYRVSWNHTKAPYGAMVEFGTSRTPAMPFIRPSLSRLSDAIEAGRERMAKKLTTLEQLR
jgi:hypothetical protein